MDFVRHLRSEAFAGLDVTGHEPDAHGWMDDKFAAVVISALQPLPRADPLVIIEVGTWKGKSAMTMGHICKLLGFSDASIVAVDTWLGAPEFWTWGIGDSTRGVALGRVNGYPSVFYTFTKNVKAAGLHTIIAPLPLSSIQGAHVLAHYSLAADLIYVDAAHEYEAVIADLRAYYPLLKPGGTLLGDDFMENWPGVKRAVQEFAQEKGLELRLDGVVWTLRQPRGGA